MDEADKDSGVAQAANRVMDLEAELEIAGNATTGGDSLARSRRLLHEWVDTVTGVVTTPGAGRVVLIHDNGRETRIASSDLAQMLSAPVRFDTASG